MRTAQTTEASLLRVSPEKDRDPIAVPGRAGGWGEQKNSVDDAFAALWKFEVDMAIGVSAQSVRYQHAIWGTTEQCSKLI